jgi:hypothetical protein
MILLDPVTGRSVKLELAPARHGAAQRRPAGPPAEAPARVAPNPPRDALAPSRRESPADPDRDP